MFRSFIDIEVTPTLLLYLGFDQSNFILKGRKYKEFYFPKSGYGLKIVWPEGKYRYKEWEVYIEDYEGDETYIRKVKSLFQLNNIFLGFFDTRLADNNNFDYSYQEERDKRKEERTKLNIVDQLYKEGIVKKYLESI